MGEIRHNIIRESLHWQHLLAKRQLFPFMRTQITYLQSQQDALQQEVLNLQKAANENPQKHEIETLRAEIATKSQENEQLKAEQERNSTEIANLRSAHEQTQAKALRG